MATFQTTVTVTTASAEVLPPNPRRLSALLINDDAANVIYLSKLAPAVANQGIRINSVGGSYEITAVNHYTGRLYAICSAGTPKLLISEDSA